MTSKKKSKKENNTDENTRWHLLTEEKLNELQGKTVASLWENNRTVFCTSKLLPLYLERGDCSRDIIQNLSGYNNRINRILSGSIIIPGGNVMKYNDYLWNQVSVFYLSQVIMDKNEVDRIKFILTYYKLCVTKQLIGHPISDYKKYEEIFESIFNYASADNNEYLWEIDNQTFYDLHNHLKRYQLDETEAHLRNAVINIIEKLRIIGLQVNIPFKTRKSVIIGAKHTEKVGIINMKLILELRKGYLGNSLILEPIIQ